MLERILVADDGSEEAAVGRDLAFALASTASAEVTLSYVVTEAEDAGEARRRLEGLACGAPDGVSVSVVVLQGPPPAPALIELAADVRADLVVAGTHGVGGLKRFLLGTVSQRLLEGAPCSVLLCRRSRPAGALTKVLVGIDGSEESLFAVDLAQSVAVALSACLILVHVANHHVPFAGAEPYTQLRAEVRRHGKDVLHAARRTLSAPIDIVIDDLREGWPRDELLVACEEHLPAVVAVGTRGEGGFRGLVLGSTARDLVNYAPCPVLVARHSVPEPA
jgi:nucleotide-binding universal stress UspA family protein